jgi:phosphoglycolate phosphatase-like HAD superfamily hydrolase
MTRAMVFDIDGTLIDTVDLHAACWTEALRHFAIDVPFEDMRVQIGKGGDQILHGLIPPDLLARHGQAIQAFRSKLFQRDYLPKARPFPGVRALFEHIRSAGQKAVLASSGTGEKVQPRLQPSPLDRSGSRDQVALGCQLGDVLQDRGALG